MSEMLANKYLSEGQIEKAIEIYEKMLQTQPTSPTLLYSLLICYAIAGKCNDVSRIATRIATYYSKLDLERIKQYCSRFTDDFIIQIRNSIEKVCENQNGFSTYLNRLVLSELLDDPEEVKKCIATIKKEKPDLLID